MADRERQEQIEREVEMAHQREAEERRRIQEEEFMQEQRKIKLQQDRLREESELARCVTCTPFDVSTQKHRKSVTYRLLHNGMSLFHRYSQATSPFGTHSDQSIAVVPDEELR